MYEYICIRTGTFLYLLHNDTDSIRVVYVLSLISAFRSGLGENSLVKNKVQLVYVVHVLVRIRC